MKFLDGRTKMQKIIFCICIIVAVLCVAAALYILFPPQVKNIVDTPPDVSAQSGEQLPDNPIDFASLKAKNTEIYAWIKVPGTAIDYPIVQSVDNNSFYLDHDAYGQTDRKGAIFTELYNTTTFDDPNTLIYGHNMKDGSMFRHLHNFSNKEFFDKNTEIYIYTPGHILKYKIVAAYKYDNRHLMHSFNFNDEETFAEYLEYVKNPGVMSANTREAELSTKDKIITLSTCTSNDNYRFLVQGVKVSDERTK